MLSKHYLILSLIIYSNVSALNGAFLKVSGRQYIQPGFIINFFLKSRNANTNSNATSYAYVGLAFSKITSPFKSVEKNIERNCVKPKKNIMQLLETKF